MKPMAPVIQWYPGTTEQTQRVATVVLVAACIAQLELGLRWLNDRLGYNQTIEEMRKTLIAQGGYNSGRKIIDYT